MMSSTWDRTGGNADGTDFKDLRIQGPGRSTRNVLLDVPGPDCIHRVFAGQVGEAQAKTGIPFFLDRHETPVIDMPVVEEQMGFENGEDLIRRTHPLCTSTAFWYALPVQASGSD
jgi:hypothetical protein